MKIPAAPFEHVLRLTDDVGMFEHASGPIPSRTHGYCLDDVARALMVVTRQPKPSASIRSITGIYLEFVERAQAPGGRCHNRLSIDRRWEDEPSIQDWWGRALWGLGTASARAADVGIRTSAAEQFERSAGLRCSYPRAMAFAALGAAEILSVTPDDPSARALLAAVPPVIGHPTRNAAWPWPESRLEYANAALAEALIAAGDHLGDGRALEEGLFLLNWLLDIETRDDHLSVTPVGGWEIGQPRPAFDQQPIEVAALADACARALRITGDTRWALGLERAIGWFLGANDAGCALYEPTTGGGCDGLHRDGRNTNQGAESTLAMVATLQHAHLIARDASSGNSVVQ